MICPFYPSPQFLFFAEGVPSLIYYSHLSTILVASIAGLFILYSNPRKLLNQILFIFIFLFVTWALLNLTLWTSNESSQIMFAWSLLGFLYTLICTLVFYFFLVYVHKKDVSTVKKRILFLLLLPTLLLLPSELNLQSFNLIYCGANEGMHYATYYYAVGLILSIWLLVEAVIAYRRSSTQLDKRKIIFLTIGAELFLFMFFVNGFLASYLFNIGIIDNFGLEQFGLFGMTFFIVVLAYMIVKYKAFNIKLATVQALMAGLVILIGSQFFFVETITNTILVAVTLLIAVAGGYVLVRSVMKEIRQREELQMLTEKLAKANERLKELDKAKSEFVSIASHQLRSPITSIRGYTSLLLEGSFGTMPEKALEPLQRIDESSKLMAVAIEDYLNISRIESGNMKYNLADFNLATETEHVCDDLRSDAIKRGLALIFRTDLHSRGIVNADLGKTVQVVQNLITNSIKYTEQGTIKVLVRDDVVRKKVYVDVIDTGIGMNAETLASIFQKFERAKNANSVNIHGTGLGLFVALKMAEAMGGTITAHSDGDGQGSRFTFELPLAL
jgi:signal transduction histidine kinase